MGRQLKRGSKQMLARHRTQAEIPPKKTFDRLLTRKDLAGTLFRLHLDDPDAAAEIARRYMLSEATVKKIAADVCRGKMLSGSFPDAIELAKRYSLTREMQTIKQTLIKMLEEHGTDALHYVGSIKTAEDCGIADVVRKVALKLFERHLNPDSCHSAAEIAKRYGLIEQMKEAAQKEFEFQLGQDNFPSARHIARTYELDNQFREAVIKEIEKHIRRGFYEHAIKTAEKHGFGKPEVEQAILNVVEDWAQIRRWVIIARIVKICFLKARLSLAEREINKKR